MIVVLTRERNYQKQPEKFRSIYRKIYKNYPKMAEALDNRHIQYNETLSYLKELEQEGKALVIAPTAPLPIGRFEKNPEQLKKVWKLGFDQTKQQMKTILQFAEKAQSEATVWISSPAPNFFLEKKESDN